MHVIPDMSESVLRWSQARGGVADTLTELSEFYGSDGPLSRRLADESLAHWFVHLADQVRTNLSFQALAASFDVVAFIVLWPTRLRSGSCGCILAPRLRWRVYFEWLRLVELDARRA